MKLSGHTSITSPKKAGYPYLESIRSFANLCDEVIVVDGGTTDGSLEEIAKIPKVKIIKGEKWERDFDWTIIGRNTNIGFKACSGDWAFHFDCDYIFHEDDVKTLRKEMDRISLPAIEMKKVNYVLTSENYFKGHFPLLVHKSAFKIICYGLAVDEKGVYSATFLKPIIRAYTRKDGMEVGEVIKMSTVRVHRTNVPVYTYDFSFMTKEQIAENRSRFQTAVHRFRDKDEPVSREKGFEIFAGMMKTRHSLCEKEGKAIIKLEEHSKFIRDKVKNIKPEQFAHSGFGELSI